MLARAATGKIQRLLQSPRRPQGHRPWVIGQTSVWRALLARALASATEQCVAAARLYHELAGGVASGPTQRNSLTSLRAPAAA